MELVNKLKQKDAKYDCILSARVGGADKQQYGFIYRKDKAHVVDTYTYQDDQNDYEWDPFAVKFHSNVAQVQEFSVINVHVNPAISEANEIDKLTQVYDKVKVGFETDNSIIAGTFNSDCTEVLYGNFWQNIALRSESRFLWANEDYQDTNVREIFNCAYDRFVIAGEALQQAFVKNSAKVFKFDEEYSLSKDEALRVSDHYPIELKLSGAPIQGMRNNFVLFSFEERRDDLTSSYHKVYAIRNNALPRFRFGSTYTKTGA